MKHLLVQENEGWKPCQVSAPLNVKQRDIKTVSICVLVVHVYTCGSSTRTGRGETPGTPGRAVLLPTVICLQWSKSIYEQE